MKKFYYLLLPLTMMMGASMMVSCGSDDDDAPAPEIEFETPTDPNVGNLSIDGYSADIKYCNMMAMFQDGDCTDYETGEYYPQYDAHGNQFAWCEIRYSSWDMTKNWETPEDGKISFLQFSFFGYADKKGEFVNGEYRFHGGDGCINQDQTTWKSDLEFNFNPTTIKIERGEDGIYTVTVPMTGYYTLTGEWDDEASNWADAKAYTTTFKYVGEMVNMMEMPEEE